ncbi:MAG TPA: alpha/beta hydrolase [Sedimenticola sp.]|nr:alpha/beta hydrolase [Sedimenticola sp.]
MRPMWVDILIFLALSYLALAAALFFLQSGMLYLPDTPGRALEATPADRGLEFEPLSIPTRDGETLDGWFIPAGEARGTLLFFHGNAGNISHRLDSVGLFHRLGLNVLIFDYRGYGRSSGKPSEAGLYRDAEAAWRYLTGERATPADEIVLFGRSLGGAVAVWLAGRVRPAGLIVESSFTSVPDMGAEIYPWLPVRLLARNRFDSRARIGGVKVPVLIIHSRQDEIIPFRHGRRLFEAAAEPKQFLEIAGGHNDGFYVSGEKYREGISEFLDGVLVR